MRIENSFLIIVMAVLVLSCGSTKGKTKQYACLDVAQKKALMTNYELTVPNGWCSALGFHNILTHSPNKIEYSGSGFNSGDVYMSAYDSEGFKSKDIEEALKAHTVDLNLETLLKPIYESEHHAVYGKYYLIKSRAIADGKFYYKLEAIFNYKNQDYIINYYALEVDFETYLPEVIQMIATFKIKKDDQ